MEITHINHNIQSTRCPERQLKQKLHFDRHTKPFSSQIAAQIVPSVTDNSWKPTRAVDYVLALSHYILWKWTVKNTRETIEIYVKYMRLQVPLNTGKNR